MFRPLTKITALLCAVLLLAGGAAAGDDRLDALLDGLLAHRMADGAIRMEGIGEAVWICPYFSHLAVFTALECAGKLPERQAEVLDYARRWLDWYARHQDADTGFISDYRGTLEAYPSTGEYDSTDSYAALYFTAFEAYLEAGGEAAPELVEAAKRALKGVEATYEPDGLTWAKPTYKAKYLMDNLEVNIGLQSGVRLFRRLGLDREAERAEAMLTANTRALERFFLPEKGYYAWAITEGDVLHASLEVYYPDLMANAFAAAMFRPANREVWNRVTGGFRETLADNLCARSYCASLRLGDADTAKAIKAKAGESAQAGDFAARRLDLLYDLAIIELDDPDFWPQVPAVTE